MNELGKGFDGTIEKAIASTEKLKDLPKIVQKYMMLGDYKSGLITKIDGSSFEQDENGKNIQNYVAQIANLDEAQRKAIESVTELDKDTKKFVDSLVEATQDGSRINGKVFESSLKSMGDSEINQGDINSLMNALGMKNGDSYALPETSEVEKNLNNWAQAAENAEAKTRLMNAAIIETNDQGVVVLTNSFKKMIGVEQVDGVVKTGLTAKQLALNAAMQIGKQLALSFGIAIGTWLVSKAVEYLMSLKTHSEELVDAMDDSHDKAEQATQDVEEIQSKIDELNKSLEDAGVKKIEDVVDPAERERLQTINDMLQAQLELKKQLEKDANNKANEDTSAVVNDKTEKSIVKKKTVYLDANGEPTDDPSRAVTTFENIGDDIIKTESLQEHADALDELVAKRRELATAGKENTQEYKDNEAAITSETDKINELSAAVSEQMDGYVSNADNFGRYQSEYVAGTNAMTAATKALANANDDVGVSTTAYDILLQKMKTVKTAMDRRSESESKGNPYTGAVKTLKDSGLETGDDIRELSSVPANQTKAQAAAIKVLEDAAKEAGVSLDQFISALETVGLVAVRDTSNVKSLSDAMSILDNMQSGYQACAQAVKEYNKSGYVTLDTLQSLCQLEPQYLNMLELKNGKLKINTETANTLTQANIKLAKAALLADTLNNIKENNNLAKAKAILGDVTSVISDADTALTSAAQKSQNEAKDSGGYEAYDYVSRANSVLIQNYKTLSALFDDLAKQDPSKIWGKTDTSKSTKQATSAIDAWSTLSSAMDEYNKQGSISLSTMKSLASLNANYTACLKKQGNELVVDANAYREIIQAELATAAATDDGSNKVAQYTQLLQYLDEHAKSGTISLNQLRDAIEGVGTAFNKAIGKTDNFQSGMKDLHDLATLDNANGSDGKYPLDDYDTWKKAANLVHDHPEMDGIFFDEDGNLNVDEAKLKKAAIALMQDAVNAANEEGNTGLAASLQKKIDGLNDNSLSMTDIWNGFDTELTDANTKLDKFQSTFSDLNDAMEEFNQYGEISQDTLQKLGQIDKKYLNLFTKNENGKYTIEAKQFRDMYVEQLQEYAKQFEGTEYGEQIKKMIDAVRAPTEEELEKMAKGTARYKMAEASYKIKKAALEGAGLAQYGNVSNVDRQEIEWNDETRAKFKTYAEQHPDLTQDGSYSTVLGESSNWDGREIAYTPVLETEDGAVPLTDQEIASYIDEVVRRAADMEGGVTAENILQVDAEGFEQEVNGSMQKVHGMVAAVQGQIVNGVELSAADVAAIGGATADELMEYFGETSDFVGFSMHDIQEYMSMTQDQLQEVFEEELVKAQETGDQALAKLIAHLIGLDKEAENFKTTLSNIKDLLSQLADLLDNINSNQSNDLKLWGEAVTDEIDDRIDALNKQKEALDDNNEATERAIELAKLQDELARAQNQKTARVYTSNGYEWQADASAVRDAQQNLADKQREYAKEDAEKAIDDQIDKLNELKDKYSEAMNDIGTSLDDYNKKLRYAAKLQGMAFDQMESNLDGYKNSIVSNMKKISAVSSMKNVISGLETTISTLEKMNDVLKFVTSGGTSSDGGGFSGLLDTVGNILDGKLPDMVEEGLGTLSNKFKVWKLGDGKKICDAVDSVFGNVVDIVAEKAGDMTGITTNMLKKFSQIFGSSGGTGAATGFGAMVQGALKQTTTVVASAGKGLISAATKLGTTIGAKLGVDFAAAGTAGGALATATGSIPIVGGIIAGLGLIIGNTVDKFKTDKKIWTDDSKSTGEKIGLTVGNFLWHTSPVGAVVSTVKTIGGFVKKIFGIQDKNDKKNNSTSNTTGTNIVSITINGTQQTTTTTTPGDNSGDSTGDGNKKQSFWEKLWGSKFWFWNWGKKAVGDKNLKHSGIYNVDEQGQELMVRQPDAGRYTYLETGDGVVPADITSRLFEMGGNPDAWFQKQLAKNSAATIQSRSSGNTSISIGDVNINNPVGDSDTLAREIITRLPSNIDQRASKR